MPTPIPAPRASQSRPTGWHRNPVFLIITALLLMGFAPARATLIQVPGDAPSIQAGVDAAVDGDTVLVAPGTYVENVKISGKAITLASEFVFDGNPFTVTRTVIDGSAATNPDSSSTIIVEDVPAPGGELRGLTITGGGGTQILQYLEGGGIAVINQPDSGNVPVAILDCVIRDNAVLQPPNFSLQGGGGITVWYSDVVLERCVLSGNIAGGYSGALAPNYCDMTIRNNLFIGNGLETNAYNGTGIYFFFASASVFEQNTFAEQFLNTPGASPTVIIVSGPGEVLTGRNNVFADATMGVIGTNGGGSYSLTYNVAVSVIPGEGNQFGVPFFDGSQFVLHPSSPGIDQGDPAVMDIEDPDNPGMALYPAQGTVAADMGAYGGPGMPLGGYPDVHGDLPDVAVAIDIQGSGEIPGGGGSFLYDVSIQPFIANPVQGQAWVEVDTPGGATIPVQVVTVLFDMANPIALSGLEQVVPGFAPAGTYTYRLAVGLYPGYVAAFDEVVFTVTGDGPRATARSRMSGSDPSAGWTLTLPGR